MPRKVIQQFQVESLSILNEEGEADSSLEPKIPNAKLKKMFEDMILMREFDARSVAMQRQGRMGTYAASTGQEAAQVGSAAALQTSDWAVPCFREQGVYFYRGVKPTILFLFYMGSEEGNRIPRSLHTLPICVPCTTQLLHAVGIAMAAKIKKEKSVIATYFGDGATSEGDFHEAMNFAGVFRAPVLFICQNNQWAISTPRNIQTHSETLAQKALGYGVSGLQVDGNDILAVYAATADAATQARADGSPTLLECITYRIDAHTTSDDPLRYRDPAEVAAWQKKDPINRFEKYLIHKKVLQPGEREAIAQQCSEQLKASAAEAEAICQRLTVDEMFTYMFAEMPEYLGPQREAALSHAAQHNGKGVAHG